MYYPLLLLSLAILLVLGTTPCSARHIININSSTLHQFSSLVWNPTMQYFVVGSAMGPTVYAILDNGTVKCLLYEPSFNSSGVSVTAVAIDQIRLRLIVAFSNPSFVSAYDLKSYQRIYTVPLPELHGAPIGVVVDSETGEVLVSSVGRGIVLKVELQEDSKRVISESKIFCDRGLSGIVYLNHGYIIVLQTRTGKIFKVDTIDGTVKEVLRRESSKPFAPSGHAIAVQKEKSIVVATNETLLLIESDKRWEQAAVLQNEMKMEGETVVAVATREGENAYVLVKSREKERNRTSTSTTLCQFCLLLY
ncbi:uncharacterized protein LOC144557981 [Carex rostrata]